MLLKMVVSKKKEFHVQNMRRNIVVCVLIVYI